MSASSPLPRFLARYGGLFSAFGVAVAISARLAQPGWAVRTHHLRFSNLEQTGDARPARSSRCECMSTPIGASACRSPPDLTMEAQISAAVATWIDRQLFAEDPAFRSGGFGAEIREAMDRGVDHLADKAWPSVPTVAAGNDETTVWLRRRSANTWVVSEGSRAYRIRARCPMDIPSHVLPPLGARSSPPLSWAIARLVLPSARRSVA